MNYRELGTTGIKVAPLAFGGNVFGYTIDEPVSFKLLDHFSDAGFNLIDTADVYARWKPGNHGGESETIIGNWMKRKGNRDKIIVATKVGSDMGQGKRDLSKAYILKAAEASLKRLQTDYIDLYQTHWDDDVTPVEETLSAYAELIKAGKVRHIGASNLSIPRLKSSLNAGKKANYPRYQTFQPLYNLYDRELFEREMQQVCVENKLGVITYSSLASGFLTGKYRSEADLSKSARGAGNKKFLNPRGFKILAALDEVAANYKTEPAAIALAWLLTRAAIVAPIASSTNLKQLDVLLAGVQLALDKDSLQRLEEASAWRAAQT